MYVLLVRPQQRKVREQRDLVRRVGVGAEVQTIGGILGRVVAADDEYVHLEISPGVVVTFVRAAVGRILDAPPEEPAATWEETPPSADPDAEPHVEQPALRDESEPDSPATGTEGGAA